MYDSRRIYQTLTYYKGKTFKICNKCKQTKLIKHFYAHKASSSQYNSSCKECTPKQPAADKSKIKIGRASYLTKNRIKVKEARKKAIETLSDSYLRKILSQRTGLSAKDIPQELIELQRKKLILERKVYIPL